MTPMIWKRHQRCQYSAQKTKFSIKELVTFTEEIINGELHIFYRGNIGIYKIKVIKRFRNLASVRRRHKDILQEILVLIILNKSEFFQKCTLFAEAYFEFRKVFNKVFSQNDFEWLFLLQVCCTTVDSL